MDIAAVSSLMSHQQMQSDASMLMMNRTKQVMQAQGNQLIDMLEQSSRPAQHPNLGRQIDVSV